MRRAVDGPSRAVLAGLFICVVLLVSLGFAGASEAAIESYFIIDGPGTGVLLRTPAGELTVLPGDNVFSRADGHIGGSAGDHCNGALHFHGLLFERADPDPGGCGWGKVTKLAGELTDLERHVSNAIQGELRGQIDVGRDPPDYVSAFNRAVLGQADLNVLKSDVSKAKDSGDIDQQTADRITRQIDIAIKTDDGAIEALKRLVNGTSQPKDREVAGRDLHSAVEDKLRVFRSLRKAKLIP